MRFTEVRRGRTGWAGIPLIAALFAAGCAGRATETHATDAGAGGGDAASVDAGCVDGSCCEGSDSPNQLFGAACLHEGDRCGPGASLCELTCNCLPVDGALMWSCGVQLCVK